MKARLIAAAALIAVAAPVWPQSNEELLNDGRNTDNVLTYGMGYNQQRYSTLRQINKSNVRRLAPVWAVSLGSNYGEQAQPLVYNGVLYATNAEASVAITTDAALAARIAPAIRIRSLRLRATAWVTSRSSGWPKHHDARKDPAPGQSFAAAHAGCARRPIGHRSCGCPNGARSDPRHPGLDHAGSTRLGSDNAVTPAGLFHTKSVPVQRAL